MIPDDPTPSPAGVGAGPGSPEPPPGTASAGDAAESEGEELRLPLLAHLDELRTRLIRSLLALAAASALCYARAEEIYRALMRPLLARLPPDSHLVFTELTEAFLTYFKVALLGGFVLASPVIFHQVWRFVSPGLYRRERRLVLLFSGASSAAFLAGMAFAHAVAVPAIFGFLMSFGRSVVIPLPSMKESFSLVMRLLLIFGVMFETPLLLFLLARAGIVTTALLRRGRKIAAVAVLLVAAVLTPPDAVSQVVVAVPLYALYEIGILLAVIGTRRAA